MELKHYTVIVTILLLFTACSTKKNDHRPNHDCENVELKYAKGFSIEKTSEYHIITVFNPWKEDEIYDVYYLVKDLSTTTPNDGKKILIPLKTLVANSATHLEFLQLLGVIDKVTGVCNAQYIYNPAILKRVNEGRAKDLGDAFNLDIENLIILSPQAVMTSAYDAEDGNSNKLKQCGIPIIYNIEWKEKSLLGRAEWIKFIAAFFDKEQLADSIFNGIEYRYNDTKRIANSATNPPSILSGQDFRGAWSMPAGQSFNAELFKDAKGNYFYSDNNESGSISTNIENALINFNQADIWVGVQANTLRELIQTNDKYKLFKAFKNKNIYSYNNRMNDKGGNDYWESAVAHPDLLLKDMVKAFHPDLLPDYEFTYMKKLE